VNYLTEPTEYAIETRQRHAADTVYARCRALGLQASSTACAQWAVEACATKIVARVCPGGTYALREFTRETWLCTVTPPPERRCRVCGCTDADCRQCIAKTGQPCHWVEADLCSACVSQSPFGSGASVPSVASTHPQE